MSARSAGQLSTAVRGRTARSGHAAQVRRCARVEARPARKHAAARTERAGAEHARRRSFARRRARARPAVRVGAVGVALAEEAAELGARHRERQSVVPIPPSDLAPRLGLLLSPRMPRSLGLVHQAVVAEDFGDVVVDRLLLVPQLPPRRRRVVRRLLVHVVLVGRRPRVARLPRFRRRRARRQIRELGLLAPLMRHRPQRRRSFVPRLAWRRGDRRRIRIKVGVGIERDVLGPVRLVVVLLVILDKVAHRLADPRGRACRPSAWGDVVAGI